MKRMSRLISALLVLAMLCAMVPAAFAWDYSVSTAKEVFVDDTFELKATGCADTSHTHTMTLTDVDGKSLPTELKDCITYDASARKGTAVKTTFSENAVGIVKNNTVRAKITCTTCNRTSTYDIKIYAVAKSIDVSGGDGTNEGADFVVSMANGKSKTLTAKVCDEKGNSTTCKQDMTCESNGGTTVSYNKDKNELTIKATKVGWSYITLTAGSATKQILVKVVGDNNAIITDITEKGKTEELSSTANPGKKTVVFDKDDTTKNKLHLDANLEPFASGFTVKWESNATTIAPVDRNGIVTLLGTGTAKITADIRLDNVSVAKATLDLTIIGKIQSFTLCNGDKEYADKANESLDLKGALTVTAKVDPTSSSQYVTWSVDKDALVTLSSNTGSSVTVKPKSTAKENEKAILTAKIGGETKTLTINLTKDTTKVTVLERAVTDYQYKIRYDSTVLERFQKENPTVVAKVEETKDGKTDNYSTPVDVKWLYVDKISDTEAKAGGRFDLSDKTKYGNFELSTAAKERFEVNVTLVDEGAVTSNTVKFKGKDTAVANDKVELECEAKAEPSSATLSYQWYCNDKKIDKATSKSYTFTVPANEATSKYNFTCEVSVTYKGKTSTDMSQPATLTVSRDCTIDLKADKTSAYTVGQSPKITAKVVYKNSTVSNPSLTWKLLDADGKELKSEIATISSSGVIATKATGNAEGQKITVQAQYAKDGYTYTGTTTITLKAASAATITMSIGDGATIKSTTVQSKAKDAVKSSSNVTLSYVKFGTPKNCTLTKSSGSSSAIGSTACYFSTTSGQKLSDVYVTLANGASTGSVSYTVYDNNDNTVATGTINFDSSSTGSITCLGIDFADANAAELIAEEFPEAEYVKFNALDVKYGRLLLGYKGIVEIDSAKDVKDSDKYYLKNSSSVDGVEELYLLPRTDYYGAINISYTAYSSSKALGEGTLTFTVVRKTASSKFTDVTSANVGSWAADAIDFMADNSLVGGVGNNKFNPTGTMTRCDLVLIMYRMAGQPSVTGVENPFTDVNTNDYFYKAVLWAYKNGVVNGTGADTFSPKKNITREQIASILFRYSGATTASGSLTSFTDAGSVSDYATTAMKWAVGAGIIGGSNGKLDPQGNATRAQVAVMLHRFLNK